MAVPDTPEQLQSRIEAALSPLSQIRVAYLFGSRAQGKARPDSDLDLALSFAADLPAERRGELVLDAITALSAALGALRARSDVLDLDRAASAIAFRVIRDGRCVLYRDPRDRVRLEASIARRYDDERPYRELFRQAARAGPNAWAGPIVVAPDVIARRLLALNETLQHLEARLSDITAERLAADPLLQAGVERWLQVAIESCIDIAYHVVAERGWTPPETARGAFESLVVNGLLSRELAERLSRAAGMRNILVHDYIPIDRAILASAVRTALIDLRAFAAFAGQLLASS